MYTKVLIFSIISLLSFSIPTNGQKIEPFPAICSTTSDVYKNIIEKNHMTPIIMNHDEEHDLLYIIFANSKRKVAVTISSVKENKTCIISIFDNATGLFDFDKIKSGDKI